MASRKRESGRAQCYAAIGRGRAVAFEILNVSVILNAGKASVMFQDAEAGTQGMITVNVALAPDDTMAATEAQARAAARAACLELAAALQR